MLTHLRINGFALLDDVEIDLGPGLNVLTGETGAGKSLLVDAVALVRGARASADVVRGGAEEARIEAIFVPGNELARRHVASRLERAGIDEAEEGLVVRRVIGRSGRGRVHVNGALSTVAMLGELVGGVIELAGQHEHQSLTDPGRHLAILDEHGVDPGLRRAVESAHEEVRLAAAALAAVSLDERTRLEREEFLRFQVRELDAAELSPGEDERLKAERERLRAAERLHGAARKGESALYGREGSVVEELGALGREIGELARIDPALGVAGRQLDEARVLLEDAADVLRRYADAMVADPERLAEVEDRLHLIGKLLRKHGGTLDEVIRRRDELQAELDATARQEERRQQAAADLGRCRAAAQAAAEALSRARREAAEGLSVRVAEALAELGMKGARLAARVDDRAAREGDDEALVFGGRRLSSAGWDRVEFLLAANPGEEARPLARVASGGELSRVMLALKRVLVRSDVVCSYVFDEVDAGIGGAVADVVGRLLHGIAAERQVLCVTHLPQIAAHGDVHYQVAKRTVDGRTATVVRRLDERGRMEELARMVGGAEITAKARAHAADLVQRARRA